MANDNEIQIVIQVATAQGKADIRSFSNTAEREFKGVEDSGRRYLGSAGLAGIFAAASGAVVLGVNRMVQKGKEFEQQMADLQAITGISGDRLDYLGDQALENSVRFGEAATNIVEAQKLVASQLAQRIEFGTQEGTEELEEIAEQAVVLSKAAGSDLNTAVSTLTSTINQFNLDADESSRIINEIAAGAKFGAAELNDQAAVYQRAGTAASSANRSFAELNASAQILAENAQRGERAGTGLRAMFTRLETRADKLAENGIDNVNVKTEDWAATLQKLQPLLSDTQALVDIFGQEHLNTARILIQNADQIANMTEKVEGTNTAYGQAATQLDTFQGAQSQLASALDKELIAAFQETNGVVVQSMGLLREFIATTGDVVRSMSDFYRRADRVSNIAAGLGDQHLVGSGLENDPLNQAEEQLDQMIAKTFEVRSAFERMANETAFFEKQREQIDKTNPKWDSYTKRIQNNRKEMRQVKESLEEQRSALQAQINAVAEASNNYRDWKDDLSEAPGQVRLWAEQLREVEKQLDAASNAVSNLEGNQSQATDTLQFMSDVLTGDLFPAIEGFEQAAMSVEQYRKAVEQARRAQDEGLGQSGDIILSGGTNISAMGRKSPRQAELFSPFNEVEQEMMSFYNRQQDVIEGWEKMSTSAEEVGDKGQQSMMAVANATDMVGSALANAVLHGRDLGEVLSGLAKQLAARAFVNGLGMLLTGGAFSFAGLLGFKHGGSVNVARAAGGGKIYGPGTTTSDSIMARLSDQEFVVNAASANAMPELLQAANESPTVAREINQFYTSATRAPGFNTGGRVGSVPDIPQSRYPSLDAIDRVVAMNRRQDQGPYFEMLANKIEDQTRRLEQVERRIDFQIAEFHENYDRFLSNEKIQGRE